MLRIRITDTPVFQIAQQARSHFAELGFSFNQTGQYGQELRKKEEITTYPDQNID